MLFAVLRPLSPPWSLRGMLAVEYQSGNLGSAAIEFDAVDYIEIYDYATDKWAQKNLVNSTETAAKQAMKTELHKWYKCKGQECP